MTHGRGSVLTIDLTNRCNMMCDPCFMDANQVGFVHELSWEDIQTMLDNAISIKPRRQMSVQFSGGEPTLSPHFLDAVRYARKVGYNSVQAATNGIEFAKSPEFCRKAAEAGLRYAYLQFDGVGNAANSHRAIGNLFDVKLRAIENLHSNGVDIVPVITIINGVNNEQVGRVIEFALDNPKKISFLSFQPVSFTGRDEEITPERREAQRYTLSHLAHDVKNQVGMGEPDPRLVPDLVHEHLLRLGRSDPRTERRLGPVELRLPSELRYRDGGHDRQGNQGIPPGHCVPECRTACERRCERERRARAASSFPCSGVALALLRNYNPMQAPSTFKLTDLLQKFDKCFGATGRNYGKVTGDRTFDDIEKRRKDRWNFLFIAGMWFQDLFNYDFRRTEQCIIPYATQEGEISFCAYNTGVGWRNIVEKMHMTATLTKWYEEKGRHEIIAGGKNVNLPSKDHSLILNLDAVNADIQHDLDDKGIAKTAREEKIRKRNIELAKKTAEDARMAKLYREVVLKEKPMEAGFVPLGALGGIAPAKPVEKAAEAKEEVGSFGD